MSECGHDGWVAGCPICEREHALALERMGEPRHCRECGTTLTAQEGSLCSVCYGRLTEGHS